MSDLPVSRGSYFIILYLQAEKEVQVGRAGRMVFPPGYYLYSGSALGPGGIKSRLGRHLSSHPKRHWHIDYLVVHATPVGYGWAIQERRHECDWIVTLANRPEVSFPARGFGAGDCRRGCPAHLAYFATRKGIEDGLNALMVAEKERHGHIHFEMLDNPLTLC